MQMAFYFDQTRCTGCSACLIACKEWYDMKSGPAYRRIVVRIEKDKYPNPYLAYLTIACLHCERPACAAACPTNAIVKREEDGVTVVNKDLCLGKDNCATFCKEACPYGIPDFGEEENAKMQMCNFCLDQLAENKNPICVDACPSHALDAGPLNLLAAKYGQTRQAEGFVYSEETMPSIIFKPKLR